MMERLRDHLGDDDPDLAFAARLAEAANCPIPTEAALDQLHTLHQMEDLHAAGRRRAAPPRLVPAAPALVAALGLVSLALAAAYLGRHRPAERPPSSDPAPAVSTPPAEPTSTPAAPSAGAGRAAPPPPDSVVPTPPVSATAAEPVRPRARDAGSVLRRDADIPVLVDALRALRRDHDPDRASLFFSYYLDRYPNGRFVEEALALSIEAAGQLDAARAASLARRYLRKYPRGAYRAAAERALHGQPASRD